MWRCVSRWVTTQVWHHCPCLTPWFSNWSVWTYHSPKFLSWKDILSAWERLGPSRLPVRLCMSSVCPSSEAVLHALFPLSPGWSSRRFCFCVVSSFFCAQSYLRGRLVFWTWSYDVSSPHSFCLTQVHQSPSMMNLSSVFERKYHTFSRSTTHLLWETAATPPPYSVLADLWGQCFVLDHCCWVTDFKWRTLKLLLELAVGMDNNHSVIHNWSALILGVFIDLVEGCVCECVSPILTNLGSLDLTCHELPDRNIGAFLLSLSSSFTRQDLDERKKTALLSFLWCACL